MRASPHYVCSRAPVNDPAAVFFAASATPLDPRLLDEPTRALMGSLVRGSQREGYVVPLAADGIVEQIVSSREYARLISRRATGREFSPRVHFDLKLHAIRTTTGQLEDQVVEAPRAASHLGTL